MTITLCAATTCGHPAGQSSFLCDDCTRDLGNLLNRVPETLSLLRDAVARDVRFSRTGASSETPLMFNEAASDTYGEYVRGLRTWQARVADHLAEPVRHPDPAAAGLWMHQRVDQLGTWHDVGHMLDDLTDLADEVEKVIDKPPARQYLGRCTYVWPGDDSHDPVECGGSLYAILLADRDDAVCDTCGSLYDASELRARLLATLDDRLVTAAEFATLAVYMGHDRERVRKLVNQWARRGRAVPATGDGTDARYRFHDLNDLLDASTTAGRAS